MSNISTHTYEDLDVPGLSFKVKGTSIQDQETLATKAVFEVQGGMGKVTVEYENDRAATEQTEDLLRVLEPAIRELTARMAEEILARSLLQGIEQMLGGGQ